MHMVFPLKHVLHDQGLVPAGNEVDNLVTKVQASKGRL